MIVSRTARGPRRALAVLLLAAAVLTLTACDPKQAGSAAVVGGVRITETRINHDAAAVLAAFTTTGATAPDNQTLLRTLVDRAIDNELVEAAARKAGITVTQGQIDKLINDNGGRSALSANFATRDGLWLPPGQIDELARTSLIELALGSALAPGGDSTAAGVAVTKFKARIAADVGVAVSPRYGLWNPVTLLIVGTVNDVSKPATGAAVLSPSASPAG